MKFRVLLLAASLFFFQSAHAERFVPKSDLISRVLRIVNNLYVDNNRVIPEKMLEGSLERLSVVIAPVLTKLESDNNKTIVKVSVDKYSSIFKYDKPKNVSDLNNILQNVVRFVKQNLEQEEDPNTVDYAVINGFLSQLDPHSSLLVPQLYSSFSASTSGNFGGVGMMIGIRDGDLTIIAPIDNTPASRAGLRSKDRIVQINEESTINMSLTDAVKKLRGVAGTKVDIFIMRKGFTSPKKYIITRDIIEIESVESFVFKEKEKRIGYLKVNTFQQNTMDEIDSHLEEMDFDLNDFQGLIFDLRNNPGGLLEQAIKVSDRFLNDGVIVSTAGLNPNSIKTYKAHWFRSNVKLPIIVLVNNGSASASEIVTAALKKNKRAVVMGIQTFGKGSVQQVIPFKQGSALRLTTSKYLTPGNVSIQSVGVTPHVAVTPYYLSTDFLYVTSPKLENAENSLKRNFAEWGDAIDKPETTIFYLFDEEQSKQDNDEETAHKELRFKRLKKDFLVQTASKILFQNGKKQGFDQLLKSTLDYVKLVEKEEEQQIVEKFGEFNPPIDWESRKLQPKGEISSRAWLKIKQKVDGKENWVNHNGPIPADSEIRLILEANNTGSHKISRLMAITEAKNGIFDDRQFAFGMLKPGQSKKWFIPIKIAEASESRSNFIKFRFLDEEKRNIHEDAIVLNVEEKSRPEFQYDVVISENGDFGSKGNGDGILQTDEIISVQVSVTNNGRGASGPLTVLLKNGEGRHIFLKKGRQSLKALQPGITGKAGFQFDLKKKPDDGALNFSLDILDKTFPLSSINQKIVIPLYQEARKISNKPPKIEIESNKLLSKNRSYKLSGNIADTKGVKDVAIFNNQKKIFYKNYSIEENRQLVDFDVDVNLAEENNRILIITRDDENVRTSKEIYLRYTGSK
jgi:carboxyl-terminal processing protease